VHRGANIFETGINAQIKETDGRALFWNVMALRWVAGMSGDAAITRAYVYNKYQKNNEHFVDLVWWIETLDKNLILEGAATVKLPKKA
jgi:hypothetical protein